MALSTQPYKGARDFYPEEMRLQKYLFAVWREVCERFGYEEYDAPILEPTELYLSKGNQEIINDQTYTFTDRGGRSVTVRTEMTPTVSRMVAAKRQELSYPLRLYSIPQCWRYERMQRGRGREFYQLNVDLFGVEGLEADSETIVVAEQIMKRFGAKANMYTIRINSRKLVDEFLGQSLGLSETQATIIKRLIDKMAKLPAAEFAGQLDALFSPSQREAGAAAQLTQFLQAKTLETLPDSVKQSPAAGELAKLFTMLLDAGVENAQFDPTILRGFDYYTDITFEVFDTDPENNRSMFGGGRYDSLVSAFGVEPLPVVGFAMGDITLANFLQSHELTPKLKPETDIYVVVVGDVQPQAVKVASQLREMGVNVATGFSGQSIDKQIKTAVKKALQYALFIGEKELSQERFVLKNLSTGEQEAHGLERIASLVKDYRRA